MFNWYYFQGITSLPNNKVAAIGGYGGTLTGPGVFLNSGTGGQNAHMGIWNSDGDLQYMQQMPGNGFYDWGYAITADKKGNIYLGGEVEDSIWATGPKIPAYHSVGGNRDFFVMKYGVDCSCTTPPVSAFTYSGTHTLSATYTGTSTGLDSVVWNFGDGSATVKGLTPVHTYTLAGTYRVTALVYTTCGNDIVGKDVVITCGLPPTAAFTSTGFHTVSFTYTGTTSTVDSTTWDFGDGSPIVKGSTAAHTYTVTGVYTACVTALSLCGSNTACKTVTVVCVSAPAPAFTKTGVYNINAIYTGTTTAVDSIVWRFGDGTPTVKGTTSLHTYTAIGIYTVCVTAYNLCGSATTCSDDTVVCVSAPVASFSDTGKTTFGFEYTGTSVAIDSTVWDFGDTSTLSGPSAIHIYKAKGTYRVCVTVYTPCGKDSACKDIIVTNLLGINEPGTANIYVYPNPTSGELIIINLTEDHNYRMLSVTGVVLQKGQLLKEENKLSLPDLSSGIYVLELTDMQGQRTNFRIIKQ